MPQYVCVSILKSTDDAVNTFHRVFPLQNRPNPALLQMHKPIKLKKEK